MRLALVHEYFCNLGGADHVAHILHTLYPDAPVFTLQVYDRNRAHPWLRGMELRPSFLQRLPRANRTHQIYLPLMPTAIERFDFSGFDLVLSSSNFIAKGLLVPAGVPHLSYTHTRQRVAWDLESEYVSAVPRPLRPLAQAYMTRLRAWDLKAAQRPTTYIANSTFVARRLQELYHRDSVVIHPPVDLDLFSLNDTPRGAYYVAVGRLVKYKRFDLAVEACKQLGRPLRIIGEGPERAALEQMADHNVQFLGTLTHAEIREQLAGARALLFGGLEDFGSSLVEAQAVGCPVIGYGAGGVLDIVRDGETGVLFSEQTAASMIEAMQRADQLTFAPDLLRQNAQQFSMVRFKAQISELVATYRH